jgi:hypothetical protein
MAYIFPKDVASSPGLKNVTGKFCFPLPVSHPGTISASVSGIRPLIVGTDITIGVSSPDFTMDMITGIVEDWGVNKGDFAVFVNTGIDGIYEIKQSDFSAGGQTLLYGPAQAVTTGYVYFLNKHQIITYWFYCPQLLYNLVHTLEHYNQSFPTLYLLLNYL